MTTAWARAALGSLTALAALGAAACGGVGGGGGGSAATTATTAEPTTTTFAEPRAVGTAAALELEEGQCYSAGPEAGPGATTTTAAPGEVLLDQVLVVDCAAAHHARVYATSCLAPGPDGQLAATGCPGPAHAPWPGERELRRAAVRLCLERFADEFDEPYATSERTTVELVPTREEWTVGHRRVVCGVNP